MTVDVLLQHLIETSARLIPQAGGGLAVEAAGAVLTEDVINAVREHKRAILKRMAIVERRRGIGPAIPQRVESGRDNPHVLAYVASSLPTPANPSVSEPAPHVASGALHAGSSPNLTGDSTHED